MKELEIRRSVRKFDLAKEVKDEDLMEIIKTSMQAPSARNQQPWEYITIKNRKIIKELSTASKGALILENAPAVICLISRPFDGLSVPEMAPQDLAICMTYMMLKATNLGLGTCYIGIYPKEERSQKVFDILKIKEGYTPFALLAVGYPSSDDAFKSLDRFDETRIHKEMF